MKKSFLSILLFLSLFSIGGYAQIDTEFWFAAPYLTRSHGAYDNVRLNFVTYDQPATVTISVPANPAFQPITRTITANNSVFVELRPYNVVNFEAIPNGTAQQTGILITSTAPVTTYYAVLGANSEIYTLKGRNALGTEFTVPMQYHYPSGGADQKAYASIEIVATEDDTQVEFRTKVQTNELMAGGTITTPVLKRGETYAIRARTTPTTGAFHLHNTKITSNKPIAVSSTDDSAASGSHQDLVGEQIVPERLAANRYVALSNGSADEYAYFSILRPNTTIYIDEGTGPRVLATIINAGDALSYKLKVPATIFYSGNDEPFGLFQLTSLGGELGGTVLPNLDCSGSLEVSYRITMAPLGAQATVLTRTENIGFFTVNGSKIPLAANKFTPVPSDPSWSYCTDADLPLGANSVTRVINSKGVFHIGIFDASGTSCSYGYFSNYGNVPLRSDVDKTHYFEGETINFTLYDASALATIEWTGPRGTFGIDNANPTLTDITIADAGMYIVKGTHVGICEVVPDTFFIDVLRNEKEEPTVCLGNSIQLTAEGKGDVNGKYEWVPGGLMNTNEITVTPTEPSLYLVKNHKPGTDRVLNGNFDEAYLDFFSNYTYGGITPTAVATAGNFTISANPQQHGPGLRSIEEHTGNNGKQLIVNCSGGETVIWQKTIKELNPNSRYEFSAWLAAAKNSTDSVSFSLRVNTATRTPITIPGDGTWNLSGYEWYNQDATVATISILSHASTASGTTVCIDDIKFTPILAVIDTFFVALSDTLQPVITGDMYICRGRAELTLDGSYTSYEWSTGETTQSIIVTEPGVYSIKVTDDCGGTGYFTVLPAEGDIQISLDPEAEICANDSVFSFDYTLDFGIIGTYSILYDEEAEAAGFKSFVDEPFVDGLYAVLPADIRPDIYNAEILATSLTSCVEGSVMPVKIKVKYDPNRVMAQKWNDVIALYNENYNGGYNFTAYQWYLNGNAITGATGAYLYLQNAELNPDDRYSVLLTRDDGVQLFTCDFIPERRTVTKQFPTLLSVSQVIDLKNNTSLTNGTVSFWTINGLQYSVQQIDENKTTIQAPDRRGMYILNIMNNEQNEQHKVVVQ